MTNALSGWDPIQVHANQTILTIKTGGDRRVANALYADCLGSFAADMALPMSAVEGNGDTRALSFTGAVNEGDVYALIVPMFASWWTEENGVRKEGGRLILSVDSNVAGSGNVLLRKYGADAPYKLYDSVNAVRTALNPYLMKSSINHWDAQHPAPALLVKLNGKFGKDAFTVVNPATVKDSATGY